MAVSNGNDSDAAAGKGPAPPSASTSAAAASSSKRKKACASRPPKIPFVPSKKRRPKATLKFVDDAAAEASEEDESDSFSISDDEESAPKGSSIVTNMKDNDAVVSSRMRHAPFFVKEEELSDDELEELIKERYGHGSVFFDEDYKKNIELEGSFSHLLHDPVIWKVKCMVGRERQMALCLLQKFVDTYGMGTKFPVLSSFAVDHVKGYIFIEADKETDVFEACKGFCYLYISKMSRMSKDVLPRLLSVKKDFSELPKYSWVRIKIGKYKGDLAQVIDSQQHAGTAIVRLVPRIDLQAVAKKFGGGESLKHVGVPSPRLISSLELEDFRPHIQIKRDCLTGYDFEILDGMKLKDGYLYKKVSVSSFSFLEVEPSKDELMKFEAVKKDDDEELHWISNMFGGQKEKKIEETGNDPDSLKGKGYETSDLVLFGRKSFGVIIGKKHDSYQILKGDKEQMELVDVQEKEIKCKCYDKMFAASDFYKKTISINDNVIVLEGSSEGREGVVRHMYKGTLFIYDERVMENCGFFCAKASMCKNLKKHKQDSNAKMIGSSKFVRFGESLDSKDDDMGSRRPYQAVTDSPFAVGQTVRIRVGPLKGYLCRILSLHRSNATVKLDSLAKIMTVTTSDLSEANLKDVGGLKSSFPSSFGTSSLEDSKTNMDLELDAWRSKLSAQKNDSWDKEIDSGTGSSSKWNIENKIADDHIQSQVSGWVKDSSSWNKDVGISTGVSDAWEKTKTPAENADGMWGQLVNLPETANSKWEKKRSNNQFDSWNTDFSNVPNEKKNGDEHQLDQPSSMFESGANPKDAATGWGKASSSIKNDDTWGKGSTVNSCDVGAWNNSLVMKQDDSWNKTPMPTNAALAAGGSAVPSKEEDTWVKAAPEETGGWDRNPSSAAVGWDKNPSRPTANSTETDIWGSTVTSEYSVSGNEPWEKLHASSGNGGGWAKIDVAASDQCQTDGWDKARSSNVNVDGTWEKKSFVGDGLQNQAAEWSKPRFSGGDFGSSIEKSAGIWEASGSHGQVQSGGWNKQASSSANFESSWGKGGTDKWGSDNNPSAGGDGVRSGCFKCGKPGHLARDCFGGDHISSGGSDCFKCGQPGHRARECPSAPTSGSECFKCGQQGHRARDCPAGGSGGSECFKCRQQGHRARDCPVSSSSTGRGSDCFKCGQSGHYARECPLSGCGDGRSSGFSCFKCGQPSHRARDCPSASKDGVTGNSFESKPSYFAGSGLRKSNLSGEQTNGSWGKEDLGSWGKEDLSSSDPFSSWNVNEKSKTSQTLGPSYGQQEDSIGWNHNVCTPVGGSDAWEKPKASTGGMQGEGSIKEASLSENASGCEKPSWSSAWNFENKSMASQIQGGSWKADSTGHNRNVLGLVDVSDTLEKTKNSSENADCPVGCSMAPGWSESNLSGNVGGAWENKASADNCGQDQVATWGKSKSSESNLSWEKKPLAGCWASAGSGDQDQADGWSKPRSSNLDPSISRIEGDHDKWGCDERPSTDGDLGNGGRNCFKCGQPGHWSRECSSAGGGTGSRGSNCFKCGKSGHWARECPSAPSGGGFNCFKYGQPGHRARDCLSSGSRIGVGSHCFKCGQTGHLARECVFAFGEGGTRFASGPRSNDAGRIGWEKPCEGGRDTWGKSGDGGGGGWGKPGDSGGDPGSEGGSGKSSVLEQLDPEHGRGATDVNDNTWGKSNIDGGREKSNHAAGDAGSSGTLKNNDGDGDLARSSDAASGDAILVQSSSQIG